VNPQLYAKGSRGAFDNVVSGTNGAYSAGPSWNPCAGWGSPIGLKLLGVLSAQARDAEP